MCAAITAQDGNKFLCALTMKRKNSRSALGNSDGHKTNKFEWDISTARKKVKT